MTKAATENDRNVSTKIVAATFENDLESVEISSERFGRASATLMQENQIIRWKR